MEGNKGDMVESGFQLSRPLRYTRESQERELPGIKGEKVTR
jgi:hypothetical protein